MVNLHRFGASFLPQMDIWFGVLPIPCSFRGRVIEGRINIRLLRRSASLLFHHTFHPSFTKMNTAQPYDFAGLAFREKKNRSSRAGMCSPFLLVTTSTSKPVIKNVMVPGSGFSKMKLLGRHAQACLSALSIRVLSRTRNGSLRLVFYNNIMRGLVYDLAVKCALKISNLDGPFPCPPSFWSPKSCIRIADVLACLSAANIETQHEVAYDFHSWSFPKV